MTEQSDSVDTRYQKLLGEIETLRYHLGRCRGEHPNLNRLYLRIDRTYREHKPWIRRFSQT